MKPLRILRSEDFKHVVSLPCPHDGDAVRTWLSRNRIPYVWSTFNVPKTVDYKMTTEEDALLFRMTWS